LSDSFTIIDKPFLGAPLDSNTSELFVLLENVIVGEEYEKLPLFILLPLTNIIMLDLAAGKVGKYVVVNVNAVVLPLPVKDCCWL